MKTLQELVQETRAFTKENRALSWWHLLSTIAVLAAFVFGAALELPVWVRLVSSLGAGLTTVRLFIIYHDYQHGAIFQNSKVAGLILDIFGILVLNPPKVWNRSHNYHHSKNSQIATASIGSFPIMTVSDYEKASPKTRLRYRLSRSPLPFLTGHVIIFIVGMCLKSFATDPKRHFDSLVSLIVHVALLVGLWRIDVALAVFAYLIPLYISCALGAYLFYIQHNFPDMKLKPRAEWDYLFAALKSSSYMTGSPITHWFTGNIGYHHVHHLNSRIPFYRLPETMKAIPELQNPGRTSLRPSDIAKCMSLKLWDPSQERMISFKEAGIFVDPSSQAGMTDA